MVSADLAGRTTDRDRFCVEGPSGDNFENVDDDDDDYGDASCRLVIALNPKAIDCH